MQLTSENYYSQEANREYMSVSGYKDFAGTYGKLPCEFHAMEKLNGNWEDEKTTALLVGSYVDSYFEGSLEQFKKDNKEIFTQKGDLKSDYKQAENIIARIERDKYFIDDVDDMIESFVGKEIMEEPLEQYDKMLSPAVQFDFKNVTFTFLPHQVKDMDALVKDLESKAPDIVGVASYEQCKGFVETLSKYQKFTDIRNVGAAIHSMIENAAQKMDDCGFTEEGEWTYLAKLFGSNAVPGESASVIQQAIKKAEKEGIITSKNRWQLIEYLCADYLSGR